MINAVNMWKPLRKSLGKKRREIDRDSMTRITELYANFEETPESKIFSNEEFMYREYAVWQPLQRRAVLDQESVDRLKTSAYFTSNSSIVKTRLNDDEYDMFLNRMEGYGLNQSAFLRKAISGATIRPVIVASLVNDELLAALGKLTAEYGRIGNNLNQIARHLNEGQTPYPELAKELRDAAVDLTTLKFDVMKKVGDTLGNVQTYKL